MPCYNSKLVLTTIVSLCLFFIAGCAGKNAAERIVTAKIVAAENINPNQEGSASPVVLNVYQLKELGNFNTSDFFALYKNPQSTLGENYVSHQQMVVLPGETKIVKLNFKKGSMGIGVVAAFNEISDEKWLAENKLTPHAREDNFTIEINKLQLNLVRQPT